MPGGDGIGLIARLGEIGDILCIISYRFVNDDEISKMGEKILLLGKDNRTIK